MQPKFLKDKTYYSDLYDRHTVERCRHLVSIHSKPSGNFPVFRDKKITKRLDKIFSKMVIDWRLMFETGERYLQKEETIREWMEKDEAKDKLLASVQPPEGIHCLSCKSLLKPLPGDFYDWGPDGRNRILFIYNCPNGCLPHRVFFDDGEEYRPKPDLCPKCDNILDRASKGLKNKIITVYTCSRCGHKENDELDLSVKKEKIDKDFAKDRERFCLAEEQGKKYLESKANLEQIGKLVDKWKEENKNKDLRDKLSKIKKLSVAGLQNLLGPVLEKEGYVKLDFSKPEMDKGVILGFTVQDDKTDREEYDSRIQLQRILKKKLEATNWRLMSEGVSYRLGILTGQLKGFESEEDLLKLTK